MTFYRKSGLLVQNVTVASHMYTLCHRQTLVGSRDLFIEGDSCLTVKCPWLQLCSFFVGVTSGFLSQCQYLENNKILIHNTRKAGSMLSDYLHQILTIPCLDT